MPRNTRSPAPCNCMVLRPIRSSAWMPVVPSYKVVMRASRASCRSEEHTSELQSLMRISYAVFCLKKKNGTQTAYSLDTSTHLVSVVLLHQLKTLQERKKTRQ